MTSRAVRRIRFNGPDFLKAGLNVTDNPLIVPPFEMVDATNILVGATPARMPRGGQEYFNTDDSDATANYPVNPKNNGGLAGPPILGIYEFWRYDSGSGAPKSTLMVRQDDKIWGIDGRTGAATDLTGSLTLPSTGRITFQAFESKLYWTGTDPTEGYNCWDGVAAAAVEITNDSAIFDGPITGVTGNVELTADNSGTEGNAIVITGDGASTLASLVSTWNIANPDNTVTLDSANGADTPANGQIMQLAGGKYNLPPDGTPTFILAHGGRMWAWGVPGFPYRAYASEFYDPTNWANTAFGATGSAADPTSLDFDPFGDPTGITGAVSFQDRLYIFLKRASFEVTGNTINNFQVRTINRQIGCVAHHTIVPVGNDVIYASERGVLRLSSTDKAIQSDYAFASRKISSIYNKLLDRDLEDQWTAEYDEQENLYILSVATKNQTDNDTLLIYNVQDDLWTTWDNHDARSLGTYVVDGLNRIVSGRENGIIALLGSESRTDFGVPYRARFKTGILYPGDEMDIEHVYKHASLLASTNGSGRLTFNMYVDSKLAGTETVDVTSGTDLLGSSFVLGASALGSGIFTPQTFRIGAKGYGLQLEVIFNSLDIVEVYGFIVDVVSADHRISGAP